MTEPMTDEQTKDGEDSITRLKKFAQTEPGKSACDWAISEIRSLREENETQRKNNNIMEKTLERRALGQAQAELQVHKLRKVVDAVEQTTRDVGKPLSYIIDEALRELNGVADE